MINAVPVLETPRLTLRGWRETDFPGFAAFCADEATRRFIPGAETGPKAWQRMCGFAGQWSLRGYGFWALERKDDGAFVGYAGFFHPPDWPEPELGWGAVPAYRGAGFVTEAARRMRAYAYQNLGWKTLVSFIHPENHPSVQVALRLGAIHERDHELRDMRLGAWRHPSPAQCHD
ncbi:MAG: acetyltransferase [Saliniramus fredricksonii]|uniref:Acetyltransferase n=1 Tax=Saliniramus fredricksonii TaxID=1653334 RepID=A0A0P8BSF8_9HYPH|nr:GNAT family N-acetyltransferase [Saliniramus fredricksonii]KPQ12680.1 MAG: acetyltransferase [Saliniramus fredricksonii]SCC82643.1 Protein N-acetyltransferase, RimJ/RimL family [Saliniramus fredricksonii]